jgi:hypothetical protein
MAIELSSDDDSNFDRVGKCSDVMVEEWWSREPISRFSGFSVILFPDRDGTDGILWVSIGGRADKL